ncbi:uncharacterized protein LOC131955016 [Physella acuta]|uniref:uncharacterized protein LOC131955016 n=1 Tax=Physella acuta TaxID=109671 RepID=UPI0027DCF21B|nr:uncharacterized protein LOC131955016 [Physella acuta]
MDKLLLFTGLPENTESIQLHGFIEKCFSHEQLKDLWMDPRQEARAVALFENVIDYERIQSKMERRQFTLEDNQIFLEKANPTNSVFVHTYGAFTSAAVDKLRMLFSSKKYNCGQVKQVVDMTGGVFEIIFENGWDSVFLACQSEWIAEKKKIDVWPFFDCFKEPADEQYKRLQKGLQLVSLKTIQSELASDSSTTNVTKQDSKEKNYTKRFDLKNKLVAFLLLNLEFESAVRDLKVEIEITASSDSWLFTFRGQRDKVKQLYKLMASLENPENQLSPRALAFFCRKRVEAQLKQHFQNSGLCIAFADEENLVITIKNKIEKEMPFNKFMKSLLKTQPVVKLTSKDYQYGKEWEAFKKSFNRTYGFSQVYIHDNSVYLMYLSPYRSELNFLIEVIKKGIGLENLEERDVEKEIKTICSSDLIWLFKVLHFDKAVNKHFQGMIYFNEKENQMKITSTREGTKEIQLIITACSVEVSKEEKQFLKDETVRMSLKSLFEKNKCHFEFNIGEKTAVFIETKRGEKIIFREFLLKILVKLDCSFFLDEPSKSYDQWIPFVESVVKAESLNSPIHVIMEDSKIKLLTVPGNEDLTASIVEKIKESIHELKFKNDSSNTLKDSSKERTISKDSNKVSANAKLKIETKSLQIDEKKYEYSRRFLMDEFCKIKKTFNCSSLRFFDGAIHIEGSTQNVSLACIEIKSLIERINIQNKCLSFPGLLTFIASPEGSSIKDDISKKFKCMVEFSNIRSKNSPRLEAVEKETVRIDYTVLLLHSARFEGFNIHLTQGKIGDMEHNMTVEFTPSKQDKKSVIKQGETSLQLEIMLPEWKSCHVKTNKEHFANLRFSLRDAVKLVLEQAKQTNCRKIGFSTEKIHHAEFAFPLDCIAEVLVSELVNSFELARYSQRELSEERSLNSVDVYVIEPECNAVFKAFDYFITIYNGKIEEPDQASWDNVCPQELSRYDNYHNYDAMVEVRTINHANADEKTLFCYPVDQSLEAETCPACDEHQSIKKILSESLQKITDEFPDGLLIGEMHRVNSFPYKKDVAVFCSSPWGLDCDKMIQTSLTNCILASNEFDAVHIVLPGMHGASKFPKKYYSQAVFKEIDTLLETKKLHKQRRIALIVQNSDYRECFESELKRRYPPKTVPKSLFERFINTFVWTSENKENEAYIWKTRANDSSVTISSLSQENCYQAAKNLEKELNHLLNKNTDILQLNQQQTLKFEVIMKQSIEMLVSVILEKHYFQSSNPHPCKSVKEDRNLFCSTIRIQGLNHTVVKEFKKKITHDLELDTSLKYFSQLSINQTSIQSAEAVSINTELTTKSHSFTSTFSADVAPSSSTLSFQWKYQTNASTYYFQSFEPNLNKMIEKAFIQGKFGLNEIETAPFKEINFTDWTTTVNYCKKAIIRNEIFENIKEKLPTPLVWTPMYNENHKLLRIDNNQDEYKNIETKLQEDFSTSAYKISIWKIERIQNKDLFKRFEMKKIQMNNSQAYYLWHRASERSRHFISQHGFHPPFSCIPKGLHLGDGVLFYFDAKDCVESKDFVGEISYTIYLIFSAVLLGRTSNGQEGLRSPPFKNAQGQEFDSVKTLKECMIFSDSQAYPCHLVSLTCRKKRLETQI